MSEITSRLYKIVAEQLGVEIDKISEDASFSDDLGADSLEMMEMVIAFEGEFGIEIPDSASETIRTVGDAVRFIESTWTKR
ncbi:MULTISPECIES: acyl carrier protein [Agrobacterium]|uniref:Acyl carrier protein n=1 Tax=Agrobacterium tumefaciens TaxID=358 RepID=A0AAE6BHS5_AGRTU|nr:MULTISPECIES: acyl carrier protein [Agrobacterium]QCL76652.1 acyl carrier protein [Agrobacterium tumefaciens]QCL82171.1 acyl carrier protein [Agrobacterium tumefaciens]WCK05479.1 acyl carrier protein [Agrobacterium tumefaciens]CUX65556.1 Acyl carrier protein (ACP) [Agrobacterium sp. NCPPB 925]